ncbi:hypothetical protein [Desulfofundulus thermobenzoicus]|uniref:hypothetical protein n=1 Tax=Desulfofundulus thermobenzoicus TaxID=29376 RepID=UPI0018843B1C|nr:hypothetical protein [Desulfofundulus thermobenzoicus]
MRASLLKARFQVGLTQSELARRVGLVRASHTNIGNEYKELELFNMTGDSYRLKHRNTILCG